MADIIMIQIRFKVQTPKGEYNDALYYTQEEYANIKQEDIDKEKQKRVDNWIQAVSNSPAYVEPTQEEWRSLYTDKQEEADEAQGKIVYTKEELEAQKADLMEQVNSIQTQIDTKG